MGEKGKKAEKVKITSPEKILFPKSKIKKKELIDYYRRVAFRMIPLMKDRPVSMQRFPKGIGEEGFFQKNVSSYFPKWLKRVRVSRKEKENIEMVVCNDEDSLVYLANQDCITPHIWLSRKDNLKKPDRMIFDLDPPEGKSFSVVVEAARDLRKLLEGELGLKGFLMLTGSHGVHVVVPIKRECGFDEVRGFARRVGEVLCKRYPKKYTLEVRKEKRKGRVFLDYLRNGFAQTGVAPYGVRAKEGAPVAVPIGWDELEEKGMTSQRYNVRNVEKRLKEADPWMGVERLQGLKKAMGRLEKVLGKEL